MDYIYGILNERVKNLKYEGVETDTTNTIVNNSTGTIAVNSKITEQTIVNKINSLNYSDSEQDNLVVTSVSENNGIISVTKKEISAGSTGYDLLLTITNDDLILKGSSFEELKEKLTVKYTPLILAFQEESKKQRMALLTNPISELDDGFDVIGWAHSEIGEIGIGKLIANDSLMFIYNGTIFSAVYNETTKEYTLTPVNDGGNQ